ncbi:MAG: RagB/SusD family nutrient uptake outer membrane protein [Flavobacteriaceae bacterium]|nr:RagB/SusD family nutrient uptake outer membrane protein [Flavobacteriaceae bacterium]
MKNTINIILSLFLIGISVSCSDDEFLELKSVDQLSTDNFWRDLTDAQAGLTAAYSELEARSSFWSGWQEGRPVIEYYRSDLVTPGPDSFNYASWQQIFNFSYNNGHFFIKVIWDKNYRGINFANQVITKVGEMNADQISDADKNKIVAEATFLRGYYHLKLLNHYEKIIIRNSLVSGDNLALPLSERSDSWQAIIDDFQAAANVLPTTNDASNTGRATKGAALAYLGKAYLHKAGDPSASESDDMQNAASALKQVIDLGAYSLESNFISMFDGSNENNNESVFEMQFQDGGDGKYNGTALHFFIADPIFGGWGEIETTNELLLDKMRAEGMLASPITGSTGNSYDHRLYHSMFFKDPYFNDASNPRMRGKTWDERADASYDNKGFFRKYIPASWTDGSSGWSHVNTNMPLMRYADVLLMYAEALNETNQTGDAIPIINNVRSVHGKMPPMVGSSMEEVKQQIIHERLMEFTLEASRFHDLRRWGMLDAAMSAAGRSGFSAANHSYLPVPLSEINANPNIN